MRRIFFQIILSVLCLSAQAQKVSNIRAEQRGQEIVVFYSLETNSPCEVSLFLSLDNGATWSGPLKNVSGHVGKNISSGEKQINWKVLEDREQLVGAKIKFKVVVSGNKSFEPEMVFVEGGSFEVWSYTNFPQVKWHTVTLKSYFIGKYEISQSQWRAVMGTNPSYFKDCDNCPVERVSWFDVQRFIEKLNLKTGKNYSLPTEAEWEYASRGGQLSEAHKYSGSFYCNDVAWYSGNSDNKTHPRGTRIANELGIFDMSGNVFEWCFDWYDWLPLTPQFNPEGPSSGNASFGNSRVVRGGSWNEYDSYCYNDRRNHFVPDSSSNYIGFRLLLPVE